MCFKGGLQARTTIYSPPGFKTRLNASLLRYGAFVGLLVLGKIQLVRAQINNNRFFVVVFLFGGCNQF